jgi:hypothetical protein
MAGRDDFSTIEWTLLNQAADAAGIAVMAAQSSGAVEEREEMFEAWRAATDQPFADNQLVLSLIRNRDALGEEMRLRGSWEESLSSVPADQSRAQAIDLCKQAMALLARKASPEERSGYRQFVLYLAHGVATAHRDGFKQVSQAEQGVLDALAAALT